MRFTRWLAARPAAVLAVAGTTAALVLGLRASGLLVPLELGVYDRLSSPPGPRQDPPIALVQIREEDIRSFGHPLCDGLLAMGLQRLVDAGATAVGVDLYRDVPVRSCDGPAGTAGSEAFDLESVVLGTDRIVMVMKYPDPLTGGVPPPPFLEGTPYFGFSDVPVDADGIVRRGLLLIDDGEQVYLSFSLLLALRALRDEGIGLGPDAEDETLMALGPTTLPAFARNDGGYMGADDGGYQFLIDYGAGESPYPTFGFADLVDPDSDLSAVEGRVAIVGTAAPSVKDVFFTTYSARLPADESAVHGMVVHAHALANLLALGHGTRAALTTPADVTDVIAVLVVALLGATLGTANRSMKVVVGATFLGAIGLAGLAWWALGRAFWVPVVAPGLAGGLAVSGAVALSVARERAERQEIRGLFSRFLRPAVADEIWRRRDEFIGADGRPASHRVELTTLMSDIRGFSTAAEKLEPEKLMQWINEYLNAMASVVEDHGGVVDDYAGDGIKANFGFPVAPKDDSEVSDYAVRAVNCALAMGDEIQRLNAEWVQRGMPSGSTRIGIYTGPAVVGVIGSEESLKYTTVGDAVNTAARLESFDKGGFGDGSDQGWRILVGGETLEHLGGAFRTEDMGLHEVKGKKLPVHIYRVLGTANGDGAANEEER